MLTRHAGIDFLSFADSRGVEPTHCDALTGVLTVMDWYEDRPAKDVAHGDDTDVLTVRWGHETRAGRECFELGIARTMVVPGRVNADAWKLTVAYRFSRSELTEALWSGSRACGSGLALPGLRKYLRGSLQGTFAKVAAYEHADVDFRRVSPVSFKDLVETQALAS